MKNINCLTVAIIGLLSVGGAIARADGALDAQTKLYPLDTCLVCGMKLGEMGKPYTFVYQGQQIELCDASEKAEFDKEPAKYLQTLANAKAKPYPLDTCLVCGMKFGGMAKPYAFAYHGREIKVCDKSEEVKFAKDPAKYMKKLAKAEAQLKK
jgi:YHS domain-containing protein